MSTDFVRNIKQSVDIWPTQSVSIYRPFFIKASTSDQLRNQSWNWLFSRKSDEMLNKAITMPQDNLSGCDFIGVVEIFRKQARSLRWQNVLSFLFLVLLLLTCYVEILMNGISDYYSFYNHELVLVFSFFFIC